VVEAEVTVTNDGSRTLLSVPPHPVHIGFQLTDAGGAVVGELEQRRAALPDPIAPGESVRLPVRLAAPDEPGHYALTFTLVQESIRWFDAVDPHNATRVPLLVAKRTVQSMRDAIEPRRAAAGSSAAR
jgi:hypothetical protein